MEKTITISELIERTADANEDEQFELLSQIEVEEYINYEDKVARMENIVQSTSLLDGKVHFFTPMIPVLFTITIIDMYTNIKINNQNILAEFNLLKKTGLIDFFISEDGIIDDDEIAECNAILNMLKDDFTANNCGMHVLLDDKLDKMKENIDLFFAHITNELSKTNKELAINFSNK